MRSSLCIVWVQPTHSLPIIEKKAVKGRRDEVKKGSVKGYEGKDRQAFFHVEFFLHDVLDESRQGEGAMTQLNSFQSDPGPISLSHFSSRLTALISAENGCGLEGGCN